MGFFGPKYSLEEFEKAKKEADSAKTHYSEIGSGHSQELYHELGADMLDKKERVEDIFNAGKKEAIELNKENDKRFKKFDDEIVDLINFQTEKLGISGENALKNIKDLIEKKIQDKEVLKKMPKF